MIGWLARLFRRPEPSVSEASLRDARAIAALHARSFRRGWSEHEIERMLSDKSVLAHRVSLDGRFCGFVVSRIAADEAEILSVAVDASRRGAGIGRRLLQIHLGRLAARGARAVFLEVEDGNAPARRLYERMGFREVGRRKAYYPTDSGPAPALVLRRNLG